MACPENKNDTIHRMVDGELTMEERHEFEEHMETCEDCRTHYLELQQVGHLMKNIDTEPAPQYFTEKVIAQLPDQQKLSPFIKWLKSHPVFTAAACFFVLMIGYIFSMWHETSFQAKVEGSGKVAYEDHTVVVPKGEVIKGNLIVKDGNVKIEGKVDGDVILINSDSLLASAGHVTGQIEEVNQIVEWIWYHIKDFFAKVFIIYAFA